MPTYIYRDIENGEMFEYKQSMNDKPLEYWPEDVPGYDPESPRKVQRKVGGGTGFILKGSGWYKTDYAGSSTTTASTDGTTKSDTQSGDAKPTSTNKTTSTTSDKKD
jgi:predicted nucleic acid-binding Zn ribbon protein